MEELVAGDIGLVVGSDGFTIGDTLAGSRDVEPCPRIKVEHPTMRMIFSINSSPKSGQDGKAIQSRELKARLLREVRANPALMLEETENSDQFYLHGRGELQFGILIEKMRREGLEFMVGRPSVLIKRDENGSLIEPIEKMTLDLPETFNGEVTKLYQQRKGIILSFEESPIKDSVPRVRVSFEIPTRGLLGTRSKF